jgi:hypothetical protein
MKTAIILTTTQQIAAERLLEGLDTRNVVVLQGAAGSGKTTVLKSLQAARGGTLLGAKQLREESMLHLIEEAIVTQELVLVDDLDLLGSSEIDRTYLLDAALTAILADAGVLGCKLVFTVQTEAPWPVRRRAGVTAIQAD